MTAPGQPTRCGPYEILAELGKGGAGVVYRALDSELGREVALKILAAEIDPARVKRFEREGQVVADVDDPGVVRVYGAGLAGRRPWIAYELIAGPTLQAELPLLERYERLERVIDLAHILGRLHERKLVHRDVKPENVLTDERGSVRLIDLGLVAGGELSRLTEQQALVGTPQYMSPEQVGGGEITPAADVWALGVILYQALTDRCPFEGGSLWEVLARITSGSVQAPRQLDATIPRSVEAVCLRALRHDPAQRHPNGEAFAADLQLALLGGGSLSPWWWVAGVSGVVLTAVATIAVLELTQGKQSTLAQATPPRPTPAQEPAQRPNQPQTRRHLEQRAAAGDTSAMLALGELCARSPQEQDKQAARRWYLAAAEAGDAKGMFYLGSCYSLGVGGARDFESARAWFRRSAEGGHAQSMLNFGVFLLQGKGGARDATEGLRWARSAAAAGRVKAMTLLAKVYSEGTLVRRDMAEATRWYERAAEAGDLKSMYAFARHLSEATGVARDVPRSLRWFRRAADLGEGRSMTALGLAYLTGQGVEQSDELAFEWFRRGADAGEGLSMLNVGAARMEGRGVARDDRLALEWFQRAVDRKEPHAYLALGMAYELGRGVKRDLVRARELYLAGARAGDTQSMLRTATFLEAGQAGAQDRKGAGRWYREAAKRMAQDPGEDPEATLRFWRKAAALGDPEARAGPPQGAPR